MALLFSLLVVLSVVCFVLSAEWALDSTTQATLVVGVGAAHDTLATAAASANGVGAFVERYQNGSRWTKEILQAGMLLDAVVTPSGKTVSTTLWNVFLSPDNGNTYTTVEGISGVSQSANIFGSDKESLGLVGSWVTADPNGGKYPASISGVAFSRDGGATWGISSTVPVSFVRYGAFPTDNTWYISSGMWGSESAKANLRSFGNKNIRDFALSERITVTPKKTYTFPEKASLKQLKTKVGTSATGWFGAVSKTTDGGKTWTQVFSTNLETDYLYFNGISCGNENTCVVVGEGYDATGNYLTAAYTTSDGGVTWVQSLTTSDVGLMAAKFISQTEVWLTGTAKNGRNLYGQFYRSTDAGKTFTLAQALENCFAIDMDFGVTVGFAACSSSSGSSCAVAIYK